MDFNNIEEYIRNGGDPQKIAQAFADQLNLAIATVNDEKEINEALEKVVFAWEDFADAYFAVHEIPKGFSVEDFYMNKDEALKIIESLVCIAPYFEKYASILDKVSETTERVRSNFSNSDSFDEVIHNFFDKMNI